MIVIDVTLDALDGKRNELVEMMTVTMAASQAEKGCALYRFTADINLPNRFYLSEQWESEEDLKAHFTQPAFIEFFKRFPEVGTFVGNSKLAGPLAPYDLPTP